MKLVDRFKNTFLYHDKYKTHSEAVIIACYFNPQNNPYRLKAFRVFYESIKHLNHQIVECVIGDSKPELVHEFPSLNITRVFTKNLLWHKETLLNNIIQSLPKEYKYVFWVDADVVFTNNDWLIDSVKSLQTNNIVQPFEYCVHLDQDDSSPNFDLTHEYEFVNDIKNRHPKMWRSFASSHSIGLSGDNVYDKHGHVGFAWGARREVLDAVPLYDRALIGGADHIIAHAAAGQIGHSCIMKSFTDDIDAVNKWSREFFNVVKGKIGYAKGDLYHIWHGDIAKRQYLKRIQDFTPTTKTITKRDKNGLHVTETDDTYVKQYFDQREVKADFPVVDLSYRELYPEVQKKHNIIPQGKHRKDSSYYAKRAELEALYPNSDSSFIDSIIWGYIMDDGITGGMIGGNMVGGMIGDMLNTNDEVIVETIGNDTNQSDSTQVDMDVPNDNFS